MVPSAPLLASAAPPPPVTLRGQRVPMGHHTPTTHRCAILRAPDAPANVRPPSLRSAGVCLAGLALAALVACDAPNHAPTIAPVADQEVAVGTELDVLITARDPDGDELSYELVSGPDGATLTTAGSGAILRWAPLINQVEPGGTTYTATVRVDDGRGGQAERAIAIFAYPEGGVPVFLNPSGFVVNLAYATRVAFLVEVKDDDTDASAMTLRLVSGIDGADFRLINGKQASFYWKPTPEQVAESSYRSIVVGADDGVHPEVQQEISIILLNADTGHCQGSPPGVQHVPPPDQHTGAGTEIVAEASDQDTLVASMTLLWSTSEPASDAAMTATPMKLSEGAWRATIPHPALSGAQPAQLRYALVARDNDDITGNACDHETRSPKAGLYRFWAYAAGTEGACADDGHEPNDAATQASPLSAGAQPALRACGDEDWFAVAVAAGQTLTVAAAWEPSHGALDLALLDAAGKTLAAADSPGAPLAWGPATKATQVLIRATSTPGTALTWSLDVQLGDETCADDPLEPNDGATEAAPLATGITDGLVLCADDRDWYAIPVAADQVLTAQVLFDHSVGDLDAVLYAPDGVTPVASSETETSNETITWPADQAGTYLLEVRGFQGQTNSYELAVAVSAQADSCSEDILAPNQTAEKAAVLPAGGWEGLTACPGASDWFAYGLNGGETVAALAQAASGAPLSVTLHGADGPLGAAGPGSAQATVADEGTVFVEVRNDGATATPYTFSLVATEPEGECRDDRFEQNDTAETATQLDQGILTRGKICGKDADVYRVYVGAFETASLWLLFGHADGDLDIRLRNEAGELMGEADSTSDDELLEVLLPKGGYYFVEVRGKGPASNAYDLVFFTED